jgi:hypothetical protein
MARAPTAKLLFPLSTITPMSTNTQQHRTSNFTSIFQTACDEYQRLTRHDLATHPLAAELDRCSSPDNILDVLQKHAQAFTRSREGDERLLAWLNPIVHILFTFSQTLGEHVELVS